MEARALLQDAVSEWNGRSNYTKTYCEIVSTPVNSSIVVLTGGASYECGEWIPNLAQVRISQSAQDGMASYPDVGKWMFMHEREHYMGVNDAAMNASPPTIMNQLAIPLGQTCAQAMGAHQGVSTLEISSSDLTATNTCFGAARQAFNPMSSLPVDENLMSLGNGCFERWVLTNEYNCSAGGCTFVQGFWEMVQIICPLLGVCHE